MVGEPHGACAGCWVCSASGYYASLSRPTSARVKTNRILRDRIVDIHHRSRGTYGAPRVHAELAAEGPGERFTLSDSGGCRLALLTWRTDYFSSGHDLAHPLVVGSAVIARADPVRQCSAKMLVRAELLIMKSRHQNLVLSVSSKLSEQAATVSSTAERGQCGPLRPPKPRCP